MSPANIVSSFGGGPGYHLTRVRLLLVGAATPRRSILRGALKSGPLLGSSTSLHSLAGDSDLRYEAVTCLRAGALSSFELTCLRCIQSSEPILLTTHSHVTCDLLATANAERLDRHLALGKQGRCCWVSCSRTLAARVRRLPLSPTLMYEAHAIYTITWLAVYGQ